MSQRKARMEADIQSVIDFVTAENWTFFRDFNFEENLFSFTLADENKERNFTMQLSDDYPANTFVNCSDCDYEPEIVSETIPLIFNKIAQAVLLKGEGEAQSLADKCTSAADNHNEVGDTANKDQTPMEEEETGNSSSDVEDDIYSLEDDDDEDDDYYINYYEEYEEMFEFDYGSLKINPLLLEHIEKSKTIFGEKSISFRTFSAIDVIDVDLHIDVSFLQPGIAHAWKVNRTEAIVIRMQMSVTKYLEYSEPKIEVFQLVNKEREKFGLGSQIKKIIEVFISTQWRRGRGQAGDGHVSQQDIAARPRPRLPPTAGLLDQDYASGDSKRVQEKPAITAAATTAKKCRSKLFSKSKTTSQTTAMQENPGEENNLHLLPFSTEVGKNSKEIPSPEHGFLAQLYTYIQKRIPTLNEYCVVCDEPHVFQNGAMLKPAVCGRELCVFAFNTLGVMQDAAECVASGAEVVDLLVSMAISAACSQRRDLVFDPYPIVVDPDNPKEFVLNPKKKDFSRIEKSLDNFISTREMTEASNTRDMKQKMDKIDTLAFPLLSWIVSSNRSHIVKLPEHRQLKFMYTPHQFLLLSSPPAKEVEFSSAKEEFGSVFAFHGSHIENWHSIMRRGLFNASSTKLKLHGAAYGAGIYLSPSFQLAFSYSAKGHSFKKVISVQGGVGASPPSLKGNVVKPAEKTRRKIKDVAAHTQPLAPKFPSNNHRFLRTKNLTCIALCEVINSTALKKHGNIWVMPDPNLVCTRFFFVYEDGQIGDMGVDTCQDKYFKEIKRVIEDQKKS